jgi:hypothetical protein
MKKILLVLLVLILVVTLTTGCGIMKALNNLNNEGIEITISDEDAPTSPAPSASGAKGWPTEDLAPGIPVYPNGIVTESSVTKEDGKSVAFIYLDNSDEKTFRSYINGLKADGWEQTVSQDFETYLRYSLNNGEIFLTGEFEKNLFSVTLMYTFGKQTVTEPEIIEWSEDWQTDTDMDWSDMGWPDLDWVGLPAELPEYTDGNFGGSIVTLYSVEISYYNTSKSAFEKYFEKVVKAGWIHKFTDETNGEITIKLEKGEWKLYLLYNKDNSVDIVAEL